MYGGAETKLSELNDALSTIATRFALWCTKWSRTLSNNSVGKLSNGKEPFRAPKDFNVVSLAAAIMTFGSGVLSRNGSQVSMKDYARSDFPVPDSGGR